MNFLCRCNPLLGSLVIDVTAVLSAASLLLGCTAAPDTTGGAPDASSDAPNDGLTAACLPVSNESPFATGVTAGCNHSCVVLRDGTARCWGDGADGELGDMPGTESASPLMPRDLRCATKIAAGVDHTCALIADGTVACWGGNLAGQLGTDPSSKYYLPAPVAGLGDATDVAAHNLTSCSLNSRGEMSCWGQVWFEGGDKFVGARADHPTRVPGMPNASSIAAGATLCAVSQGHVYCLGSNIGGEVGDGTTEWRSVGTQVPGIDNAVQVATSGLFTCAVLADGTARCWGTNDHGQLGDGTQMERFSPGPVVGLTNVAGIALGKAHACAWLRDGTARCWGSVGVGALGDGAADHGDRFTPVVVKDLHGVASMALGCGHTCAVLDDGSVACWGDGIYGQIGTDTGFAASRSTPTHVHLN